MEENLVAVTWNAIREDRAINEAIRREFKPLKKEFLDEVNLIMTQNRMDNENRDMGAEIKELTRDIDELKQIMRDLNGTCDSLYKVMRSFK